MHFQTTSKYDNLLPAMLLATTAGGIDAYTYLEHGSVFAGLQTGNLILLGIHLGQGQPVARYVFSLIMFMVGITIVRLLQHRYPSDANLSRSTLVILYEILLISLSGWLSQTVADSVTTGLLSMAAAGQLQEFRRLTNRPFTSLMMTGHIRTLAESLYDGLVRRDRQAATIGLTTFAVITSFVIGAVMTAILTQRFHHATIWISAVILLIVWLTSHFYRQVTP